MSLPALDPALVAVFRLGLALLLASAALHKVRDPQAFRIALGGYRVLPDGAVRLVAGLVPVAEMMAAALLAVRPVLGGASAALVLSVYAAAMIATLWRGDGGVECGCGGPGGSMVVHWGVVVRNVVLVAAALVTMLPTTARAFGGVDVVTVLAGVVALGLVHAAADTALATWVRVRELRVAAGAAT